MSALPDPIAFGKEVGVLVKSFVSRELEPLRERITELEQAQTKTFADAWQGAWRPDAHYARGMLTTHAGALWLAVAEAAGAPGSSSSWRLVVKSGRDAT